MSCFIHFLSLLYIFIFNLRYIIERKSIQWLAQVCDGDARIALGALELVLNAGSTASSKHNAKFIGLEDLKNGIKV